MRALLPFLALLALPAAAQDLPFSAQITRSCLANAQAQQGSAQACIGIAAERCMAGPGGSTTVGMGSCLGQEWRFWDDLLNQNYQTVMAQAKAMDAEMRELGSSAASQAEALRAMQRAWIPFRDAACAYEASTWGGGSGAGPASAACMMELTAAQALRLTPQNN
jgi:uncharacterized protein YecT (DUF1311 family)